MFRLYRGGQPYGERRTTQYNSENASYFSGDCMMKFHFHANLLFSLFSWFSCPEQFVSLPNAYTDKLSGHRFDLGFSPGQETRQGPYLVLLQRVTQYRGQYETGT